MKILVTGASGHLGGNLVRRLLKNNQLVKVLLRPESNNEAVQNLDVEKYYGDLRNENAVLEAMRGCDRVYHCGAKISTQNGNSRFLKTLYDCNVIGTIHILRAARQYGVSRVVVTSSDSAVGYNPPDVADENSPVYPFYPFFPYGTTKVCVEHECLKAFADGLDVVIATCCAIVGPKNMLI
uniref:NAD-dependent epimerase/dehydratase n=1 Tax=Prochloron didemni P2-Fiji TaxID=910454 RepID=G0XS47_PRODI|nr:NAD-dependent epimerase/dehydratase [Prochloron didemni P2-Fiji]